MGERESTILKVVTSSGSGSTDRWDYTRFSTILVEGYDTSLHEYALELSLRKHFSSCGKIVRIHVPRNFEKGILERFAFIRFVGEGARFVGEGALEKALQLNGSDVGGWRVFVAKASPNQDIFADPAQGAVRCKHFSSKRTMVVTGYDTRLPDIDIQIGLSKHFSSCGEVTDVMICGDETVSKAHISILGEGAVDKALKLSGRDVGGWNITVVRVLPPQDAERRPPPQICRPLPKKEATKMTVNKEEANKMTEVERKLPLNLLEEE